MQTKARPSCPAFVLAFLFLASLDLTAGVIVLGADPETTVIAGDDAESVVNVYSDISVDIRSLTVRNGHASNGPEGGRGIDQDCPLYEK